MDNIKIKKCKYSIHDVPDVETIVLTITDTIEDNINFDDIDNYIDSVKHIIILNENKEQINNEGIMLQLELERNNEKHIFHILGNKKIKKLKTDELIEEKDVPLIIKPIYSFANKNEILDTTDIYVLDKINVKESIAKLLKLDQ